MAPSESVENYLKAVFSLHTTGQPVTTGQLAERLHVSQPAVSAMVKRLVERGLLVRDLGGEVVLTEQGQVDALAVVRRHRLVETFLHRMLHMPWDRVHDEAERLEHAISDQLEAYIDAALGHPTHDPHGDPIPQRGGAHQERWTTPLEEVVAGTSVCIDRVVDDPPFLRALDALGMTPGATLTVEELAAFGGPVWVRLDGVRHPIGRELARAVYVSAIDEEERLATSTSGSRR